MKKWIVLLVSVVLFSFATVNEAAAQSMAYVDTEAVLKKLPTYQRAQTQLDQVVDGWRKEIEQRYKEIDRLYRQFQAEQVLLSEKERVAREENIVNKEKETRALQNKRFGEGGDLHLKRQELVTPIQQQVFSALEKVSKRKNIDMVFDKASGVSILYANPKFDLTGDVLKELGISDNN